MIGNMPIEGRYAVTSYVHYVTCPTVLPAQELGVLGCLLQNLPRRRTASVCRVIHREAIHRRQATRHKAATNISRAHILEAR